MSEINFLSAAQMTEQIRSREFTPSELVEAHLTQIERLNPKLNAFVQVDAEGARKQAQECESLVKQGKELGPLHGVPISIKSSIEVTGMRCEAGSKLLGGEIAKKDAVLVTRLRNAGAIVLGTTNTPEFL